MVVENCGLQLRQLSLNLFKREGLVVGMAVNADIHADTPAARQGAMAMAMQHPGAVVVLIPHVEGVVTHHDLRSAWSLGLVEGERPAPIKEGLKLLVVQDDLVVIARKEADAPVKPAEKILDAAGVTPGEISEVIDHGALRDLCIPSSDKLSVHLFNAGEGAVAVLDDILVSEMGVGRDKFVA